MFVCVCESVIETEKCACYRYAIDIEASLSTSLIVQSLNSGN